MNIIITQFGRPNSPSQLIPETKPEGTVIEKQYLLKNRAHIVGDYIQAN